MTQKISPSLVSEITDTLILTSAAFVNRQVIERFGISCVISCAPELPDPPIIGENVYYKIDAMDTGTERIFEYFDATTNLIQQVSFFKFIFYPEHISNLIIEMIVTSRFIFHINNFCYTSF